MLTVTQFCDCYVHDNECYFEGFLGYGWLSLACCSEIVVFPDNNFTKGLQCFGQIAFSVVLFGCH